MIRPTVLQYSAVSSSVSPLGAVGKYIIYHLFFVKFLAAKTQLNKS